MADQTPSNSPFDDRLRATFNAEHADVERRHLAAGTTVASTSSRSTRMPLAIAAALLAIAGFAFFGNRSSDTAIDLGVAEQPADSEIEKTLDSDDDDGGAIAATTGEGAEQAPEAVASPSPTPTPTVGPNPTFPTATPVPPGGTNFDRCAGVEISRNPAFVWGIGLDDPDGGLVAHTDAAIDAPITRILPLDSAGVRPTGQCRVAANGSPWFEILGPSGPDWVSSNFIKTAQSACLTGEHYGAVVEDGEATERVFGPLDGWAIMGTERVAFAAGINAPTTYRWYPADAVAISTPCFNQSEVGEEVCLSGQVVLFNFTSPEPLMSFSGSANARTTGRLYTPLEDRGLRDEFIEVAVAQSSETTIIGFVDPAATTVTFGACPTGGSDALADLPCTAASSEVVVGSTDRGTTASDADHVHNIRTERAAGCTRIVIDFGIDSTTDTDALADRLPLIGIDKNLVSTTITLPATITGLAKVQRVDFDWGVTLYGGDQVVTLHRPGKINVWFSEFPARAVIDIEIPAQEPRFASGPITGRAAVLSQHIQTDLFGPGIPVNTPVQITGFARPFEASGQWYVLAADESGKVLENREPVAEGIFPTTRWVDGWGEFQATLPALPTGHYVALYGSSPPRGDIFFAGSGQYFRVGLPADGTYAEATEILHMEFSEPFPRDS